MRQVVLLFIFFLSVSKGQSQNRGLNPFVADEQYFKDSKKAIAFYDSKEYLKSALLFDSLYKKHNNLLSKDKYFAASCWSLVGNSDKAFFYLDNYAKNDKELNLSDFLNDPDLYRYIITRDGNLLTP